MGKIQYASGVEDVEVSSPLEDEVDYGMVQVEIDSDRCGRTVQILIPNGGLAQMGAAQLREFIAAAQGALDILDDDDLWR